MDDPLTHAEEMYLANTGERRGRLAQAADTLLLAHKMVNENSLDDVRFDVAKDMYDALAKEMLRLADTIACTLNTQYSEEFRLALLIHALTTTARRP